MIKKILMALILAAMAAIPASAQLTGCQYTSGAWQLQKVRSTAVGSQIIGCINATFEAISSSVPLTSTTSVWDGSWMRVNRISGHATGQVGVQMSSYTWFTSSAAVTGGGGLDVTYGVSAATGVFTYIQTSSITPTVGIYNALGAQATPSYSFAGNTNAGFYADANSVYAIAGGQKVAGFSNTAMLLYQNINMGGVWSMNTSGYPGATGIGFANAGVLNWASASTNAGVTGDAGLARVKAGTIRVTDGSTSTGTLIVSNLGVGTGDSPATKLHVSSGALTVDGTDPKISVRGTGAPSITVGLSASLTTISADQTTITDGTNSGIISARSAGGGTNEVPAGIWLAGNNGYGGVLRGGTSVGNKAAIAYFDGTQYRSGLDVASTTSGFSTTTIMGAGGATIIGTNVLTNQLFYCAGGTFDGNVCRGAACLCTGGTATALSIYVK